ncbi:MAG: winged helix-turn-helix transcriptional regulator [Candidatus Eisenbacteria bacterium]|uniref:Winged helix-turn-helix transcriptional regulator n=1 Tax=Eiseniibacteriota bacterium TaxID=2212470 RepID=A0A849SE63_UNCEI|nr:winged helix-turn-helix transcriptional regulator [Candidatus Eisenbacteria bacterium]
MMVTATSSPFGSSTRTRALLAMRLLVETYARELARFLDLNLSGVQKALRSLEADGLVAARAVGRTRVYRLGPRAGARKDLERYLDGLLVTETKLRAKAATLRRRPRKAGKPA